MYLAVLHWQYKSHEYFFLFPTQNQVRFRNRQTEISHSRNVISVTVTLMSLSQALARLNNCLSPTDNLTPFRSTRVLSWWGRFSMRSHRFTFCRLSHTSESLYMFCGSMFSLSKQHACILHKIITGHLPCSKVLLKMYVYWTKKILH